MAQRRTLIGDGLFWGMMAALMAGVMGGSIGFVFATLYGAGWLSGAALGAAVFLVAGVILSRTANSVNLPPPNTLKAPVAPPGGAFQAPPGGRFQAPAGRTTSRAAAPAQASAPASGTAAEIGEAIGEGAGKAAFAASAAVTSAAEAARAAIADILGSGTSTAPAEPAAEGNGEEVQPAMLSGPRDGKADDLKRIKGIGPKFEELLHASGIYHFDQIAAWGPRELAWVDAHLEGFGGRALRDDWVGQAKLLAAGGETEFSERVDKGEVY